MSSVAPGWGLLCLLLLLSGGVGWLLRHALRSTAQASGPLDLQAQTNRQIQRQHLADLAQALAEGRLTTAQHAQARDAVLRQVLSDSALPHAPVTTAQGQTPQTVPVGWIALFLALSTGVSYALLGASQTWWPLPLSQRVQITATTPEQLQQQTAQWTRKVEASPNDAQAWLTLARLHAARHAPDLAESALARVLALSPEPDVWIERAQMKAQSAGGVYTGEPWQWIEQVLQAQPQHLNALVLAGSAALSEQRPQAAMTYWQKALALVPPDSEAAQSLQPALEQADAMWREQQAAPTAAALQSRPQSPATSPAPR